MGTLGTAVAIFLLFRNSSACDRWWEVTKLWGGLVNRSRTFARQVLTSITGEESRSLARELVYRQLAFVNALLLGVPTSGNFVLSLHSSKALKGTLAFSGFVGSEGGRIGGLSARSISSPPAAAPEVDTQGCAAPLALTLGGLALMSERRRRKHLDGKTAQGA